MKVHPVTGLVPCEIKVSEAGLGLRAGEIRGLMPDVAEKMIKAGAAKAVEPEVEKPARAARSAPAAE